MFGFGRIDPGEVVTLDEKVIERIIWYSGPDAVAQAIPDSVVKTALRHDLHYKVEVPRGSTIRTLRVSVTGPKGSGFITISAYGNSLDTREPLWFYVGEPETLLRVRAGCPPTAKWNEEEYEYEDDCVLDDDPEEFNVSEYEYGLRMSKQPVYGVGLTQLDAVYHGMGIGRALYNLTWYVASLMGFYFESGNARSGFAERTWRAFADKGLAFPELQTEPGEFYRDPHEKYADDLRDVNLLAQRGYFDETFLEVLARLDQLEDIYDEASAAYDEADAEEPEDDDDGSYDEHIDRLEALRDAALDEWTEAEADALYQANQIIHERNGYAVYPECWGDCDTLPRDPDELGLYEGYEVGMHWEVYSYCMLPLQLARAGGLFGLGGRAQLPDDPALDF